MSDQEHSSPGASKRTTHPEQWVSEYGDYLYRYALMRVRNTTHAEDLVQEALLAAFQARHNFAGQSSEKTWLIGILKHKIIDYFRRTKRERLVDPAGNTDFDVNDFFDGKEHWRNETVPLEWPNPTQAIENQEFVQALMDCLSKIPSRTAEAFSLRELEELSSEEVCNILDITPNNFWVMMHRARMALRKCLENGWLQDIKDN